MLEQRKSPPPEKEEEAEAMCNGLTAAPFPVPLHHSGEGCRETGVKSTLGRREGWGECVFRIWIYFSLSYSDLIGDELNCLFSPSSVSFVCNGE